MAQKTKPAPDAPAAESPAGDVPDASSADAPAEATLRSPREWGRELRVSAPELAGLLVLRAWDRDPGLVVTQAEFEAAAVEFAGLEVGR